jgi:hypothetical protein
MHLKARVSSHRSQCAGHSRCTPVPADPPTGHERAGRVGVPPAARGARPLFRRRRWCGCRVERDLMKMTVLQLKEELERRGARRAEIGRAQFGAARPGTLSRVVDRVETYIFNRPTPLAKWRMARWPSAITHISISHRRRNHHMRAHTYIHTCSSYGSYAPISLCDLGSDVKLDWYVHSLRNIEHLQKRLVVGGLRLLSPRPRHAAAQRCAAPHLSHPMAAEGDVESSPSSTRDASPKGKRASLTHQATLSALNTVSSAGLSTKEVLAAMGLRRDDWGQC